VKSYIVHLARHRLGEQQPMTIQWRYYSNFCATSRQQRNVYGTC